MTDIIQPVKGTMKAPKEIMNKRIEKYNYCRCDNHRGMIDFLVQVFENELSFLDKIGDNFSRDNLSDEHMTDDEGYCYSDCTPCMLKERISNLQSAINLGKEYLK